MPRLPGAHERQAMIAYLQFQADYYQFHDDHEQAAAIGRAVARYWLPSLAAEG